MKTLNIGYLPQCAHYVALVPANNHFEPPSFNVELQTNEDSAVEIHDEDVTVVHNTFYVFSTNGGIHYRYNF